MGSSLSSLPDVNKEDCKKFAHFPSKDVNEWTESFKTHFPRGFITVKDLETMFKRFFPFGSPKKFSNRLFETINISQSNQIDFHELLIAFSILIKGSSFEKLRWMFRFYDEDNDGVISKQEMVHIAQAIVDMTVNTLDIQVDVTRTVEELFEALDNKSGFLTFDDFKELSVRRQETFNTLVMFLD